MTTAPGRPGPEKTGERSLKIRGKRAVAATAALRAEKEKIKTPVLILH
jgi:hypothetical protein